MEHVDACAEESQATRLAASVALSVLMIVSVKALTSLPDARFARG